MDDQRQSDADERLTDPTTSNAILFDESPSTSEDVEMRETCSIEMRSKSTQTSFKPAKVSVTSVKTQTIADTTSMFFQTTPAKPKPTTTSAKTQTSPDKASTTFSPSYDTINLPIVTDAIDDDVQLITAPREVDQDSTYARSSSSENLESENEFTTETGESSTESDDENRDELDERTILKEGKPPQDQVKLIVFEVAILNMFSKCSQCGSKCVVTLENKIGSLCTIYSSCTINSRHYFEWETGPLVNRMPVFHLLFAAGILATGMESAKALRLFSSLKVPNVKRRQLSNILKNYVIPAVYNVWRKEQSARLKEIEGKPIVVASDMRVDSPAWSHWSFWIREHT